MESSAFGKVLFRKGDYLLQNSLTYPNALRLGFALRIPLLPVSLFSTSIDICTFGL
jgi:hypothetical protein